MIGVFVLFYCRKPVAATIVAVPSNSKGVPNQPTEAAPTILPIFGKPAVRKNLLGKSGSVVLSGNEKLATAPPQEKLTATENQYRLLRKLRDMAPMDLDATLTQVLEMPNSEERNKALQAVCFGLSQKNPALAMEMAQDLQQPTSVLEGLMQQWASSDIIPALVWANDQPAGDLRDQLIQRAAFVLSKTDPSDAAGLVVEQIPPGPTQNEAIMTVLHQWGSQNLQAATSWVQTFADGQLKERATEELEGIVQYEKELARQ